jgi:hypothetical protein
MPATRTGPSMLKSWAIPADTFHMPIFVKTELPHESDQPGDGDVPEAGPTTQGMDAASGAGRESITRERLTEVIRKLETGFYDSAQVREHVARRVREELGP